jgi:hypothetical protein
MVDKTSDLLDQIRKERDRQKTLPGSEFDSKNTINDWIAIAGHYLNETAKRKSSASFNRGALPSVDDYESSLIKAAAVILAALEHSEQLVKNGDLQ